MEKSDWQRVTVIMLVVVVVAYFMGVDDGEARICDVVGGALQDSPRVRAVIVDEHGKQYMEKIEQRCLW